MKGVWLESLTEDIAKVTFSRMLPGHLWARRNVQLVLSSSRKCSQSPILGIRLCDLALPTGWCACMIHHLWAFPGCSLLWIQYEQLSTVWLKLEQTKQGPLARLEVYTVSLRQATDGEVKFCQQFFLWAGATWASLPLPSPPLPSPAPSSHLPHLVPTHRDQPSFKC